jgi:3-hydroxybutyryl-CoA dehydrogenase
LQERLGIAGSGAIACGLAVTAARTGSDVLLWARSDASRERARATVAMTCSKLAEDGLDPERVQIVSGLDGLADSTFLVEAVVEHHGSKAAVLTELVSHASPDAVFATTTSSLSIDELARATGVPDRFLGLHVFNPVPRMKLVELAFPQAASSHTRERARAFCDALGKTAVEVPDIPGFVVNRLLFPYLFTAVELMTQTGLAAADVDQCMMLGAAMPMGPLALLDYVGLDVSMAIGETIGAKVPRGLVDLVDDGALGRKSKRGFYSYD